MDITNILNRKGSAAAAAIAAAANPEHQLHQHLARAPRQSPSDSDSDAAASAYGSETSSRSRYSSRPTSGLQVMTNTASLPDGLAYPSPTSMQTPLPMLQDGLLSHDVFEGGSVQADLHGQGPGRPPLGSPTQKAFPCSSCGKGFARRSDLARHGASLPLVPPPSPGVIGSPSGPMMTRVPVETLQADRGDGYTRQNASTRGCGRTSATIPGVTNSSSSGRP